MPAAIDYHCGLRFREHKQEPIESYLTLVISNKCIVKEWLMKDGVKNKMAIRTHLGVILRGR